MKSRFIIAIAVFAVIALVAIIPVSAGDLNSGGGNASYILSGTSVVFLGEQGLNFTSIAGNANTSVSWYSANTQTGGAASKTVVVGPSSAIYIDPGSFSTSYPGQWYWGSATWGSGNLPAFLLADPSIDIQIRDMTQDSSSGKVVTGASVAQGDKLTFVVQSNVYSVYSDRQMSYINGQTGYVNIRVRNDQGATLTSLVNETGFATSTYYQNVNRSLWYWGDYTLNSTVTTGRAPTMYWATGYTDASNTYLYPAGTYAVTAEVKLNHMKDNYKDATGADYSGKTVSSTKTITIVPDTVQIASNRDSVIRGSPFSVTVTGKPNTYYFLWVRNISSLTGNASDTSGGYGIVPPTIDYYQSNVYLLTNQSVFGSSVTANSQDPIGNYTAQNNVRIQEEQPFGAISQNGTQYRTIIKTDDSGKRTIQLSTTRITRDQKYTIRVERDGSRNVMTDANTWVVTGGAPYQSSAIGYGTTIYGPDFAYVYFPTPGANIKSDEVDVTVQKGPMTINTVSNPAYIGDIIRFYGTNADSRKTYLFLTGPGIASPSGVRLDNRSVPCVSGDPTTFTETAVLSDNTWSYSWDTTNLTNNTYDTYIVYAVSYPITQNGFANVSWDSTEVAFLSQSTSRLLTLHPGWNFVSTPIRLSAGNDTAAIFSKVNTSGHSVFTYNTTNSAWVQMTADSPVRQLDAFWIYSNTTTSVVLYGDTNPLLAPGAKYLPPGWNMIGTPGPVTLSARDGMFSVSDQWSTLLGYNAQIQSWDLPIVSGGSGDFNDSRTLAPGKGYWVYMRGGGTYAAVSN